MRIKISFKCFLIGNKNQSEFYTLKNNFLLDCTLMQVFTKSLPALINFYLIVYILFYFDTMKFWKKSFHLWLYPIY